MTYLLIIKKDSMHFKNGEGDQYFCMKKKIKLKENIPIELR